MLRYAATKGRAFVILLPVSDTFAAEFMPPERVRELEDALAELQRNVPQVHWLRLDQVPRLGSDDNFCDLVHMNYAGQKIATEKFLAWVRNCDSPMIFTSVEFAVFFLLVLVGVALLPSNRAEKRFLLIASYVFYMSWNVLCGGLLFFTSALDYYVGRALGVMEDARRRRLMLTASLVANLGVLAFFKYSTFLIVNAQAVLAWFGWHPSLSVLHVMLPAGISFLHVPEHELHDRRVSPAIGTVQKSPDFLLFVSFFTQLIAGPIVRASKLLPQFAERPKRTAEDVETGIAYFRLGAVKKLVISDQIAPHVDVIFANPAAYDAPTLVLGVLGYAVQIYCDFSGYSDMAFGCARILGYWLSKTSRCLTAPPTSPNSGGAGTSRSPPGSATISIFRWAETVGAKSACLPRS